MELTKTNRRNKGTEEAMMEVKKEVLVQMNIKIPLSIHNKLLVHVSNEKVNGNKVSIRSIVNSQVVKYLDSLIAL